ncbi:septal ring lytic transglycosylase RlpA family protein [Oceanicaulis sp. LC35]|uniref:septal ring lytic transglycosylase RlpA family protein n=1 Tax=Oceanicaulis sp. LC35 TaxID=3349635 RepID=UPI003F85AC0F
MPFTKPFLFRTGLALLAGVMLVSCSGQPPQQSRLGRQPAIARPTPPPPVFTPDDETPRSVETGLASWYGPGFEGRQTANGEVFDSTQLTAAHRTMRLPSRARVTRLDTGASIIVRVNDRGPYIDGRLIDLSHAAAEALGFTDDGLIEVRVEGLGPADLRDRAAPPVFFNPEDGPPGAHTPSFTQNLDATLQPSSDEG